MDNRKKPYTVFISSTFLDNRERRKRVEDAVSRAGMIAIGMERFTASAHPTVKESERQARERDIYLGIVAHRYGWIPEGKAVSITQLEYEAAKAAGRSRLMFEIDKSISPASKRTLTRNRLVGASRSCSTHSEPGVPC